MPSLTPLRQKMLEFISQSMTQNGYPPSLREIGAAIGRSSSATVHRHLEILQDLGLLQRSFGKTRAISVLEPEMAQDLRDLSLQELDERIAVLEHQLGELRYLKSIKAVAA